MYLYSCATAQSDKIRPAEVKQAMTVARIIQTKDDFAQVVFLQSQRFYKLPNDADPSYMNLLKESEKNNAPVTITRASEYSDIILSVER